MRPAGGGRMANREFRTLWEALWHADVTSGAEYCKEIYPSFYVVFRRRIRFPSIHSKLEKAVIFKNGTGGQWQLTPFRNAELEIVDIRCMRISDKLVKLRRRRKK